MGFYPDKSLSPLLAYPTTEKTENALTIKELVKAIEINVAEINNWLYGIYPYYGNISKETDSENIRDMLQQILVRTQTANSGLQDLTKYVGGAL